MSQDPINITRLAISAGIGIAAATAWAAIGPHVFGTRVDDIKLAHLGAIAGAVTLLLYYGVRLRAPQQSILAWIKESIRLEIESRAFGDYRALRRRAIMVSLFMIWLPIPALVGGIAIGRADLAVGGGISILLCLYFSFVEIIYTFRRMGQNT